MTKIKLCGLTRQQDIDAANEEMPDYIGFVFAPGSKRYILPERAAELRKNLHPAIHTVGVFVNENPETIVGLRNAGVIDTIQLHGGEKEEYIAHLRTLTDAPIIKAFRIASGDDVLAAEQSSADFVLLDSGGGTGTVFDWALIKQVRRSFFLAGGLGIHNVKEAIDTLSPYAVDVSSGIETDGVKDKKKMAAFVAAVRKEEKT